MTDRTTRRWRGVVAIALLASVVGVLANRPSLLLLASVGVVYGAYPRVTSAREPELEIDRRLSDDDPSDGDPVEVDVTVTNVGDATVPDCRVVDGVPPMLTVTDGVPRCGATLRPGASASFSYTVVAKRGIHSFEPATVVARDLSGEHEVETSVATDTEIDCTSGLAATTVRSQTLDRSGEVAGSDGGAGIEFHRTREYQRGDPMNRIDWNRYARTGDLSTTEFRQDQAASVVCLVDARECAYRSRPGDPHAVALAAAACEQLATAFAADRNQVGVAAFAHRFVWQEPGMGPDHVADVRRLLSRDAAFSSQPPSESVDLEDALSDLRERLRSRTQVLLLSPLCDDEIVDAARRLDAFGHAVTVVAPDVTVDDSPGTRFARVQYTERVRRLRSAGIPTVEWQSDEPLEAALARQRAGGATFTGGASA
ncbi:DUF58 domain-containing protein [Halorubellus litoreus]|uniref:DUF58 domain-containing protein n=1 Tax=Halorubellus litoreus TaxID=755308 RepID=A0ABD5VJ17_9EURY